MWLVGEGGIYGYGCKEIYRFPHNYYLSLLLLYLLFFAAASLLFVHFLYYGLYASYAVYALYVGNIIPHDST